MKNAAIKPVLTLFMFLFISLLTACSSEHSDPGPLKGTWQITGIVDSKITFRDGETQTKDIVEKCRYQVEGKKVFVTYLSGMAKGMTQTYLVMDKNTVESSLGIMKRIQ